MVTVQTVYDTCIHLMDEQNENSGATVTADTDDYRKRTINILNMAIAMVWKYCAENDIRTPGRDMPAMLNPEPYNNPDFSQFMPVDDAFCYAAIPYFLASELLTDEDADRSERYRNRYMIALQEIKNSQIYDWEQIVNPFADFSV